MALKAFWYLNLADGDYPWMEGRLYPVDFGRYRRLAETVDCGGFYGALVATWPNDPLVSASFAASYTKQMRFLVAIYARMTPAKLLAQQALSFDAFSGGRLHLNLINGRDNIMETYGVVASHDDRYKLGEAYWREFHAHYRAGGRSNFPNTPLEIPPTQPDGIALWGAGDSEAGLAHAGAVVDVYLTMLRKKERIGRQFDRARESAARQGRAFTDIGALASVIVRPTRAQAQAHFHSLFERTGVSTNRGQTRRGGLPTDEGYAHARHFPGSGRAAARMDSGSARGPPSLVGSLAAGRLPLRRNHGLVAA
jgi:alkanesulfonate monooxygenase